MQKGLSRERTSYRSLNVPCDEPLVLVCCRKLIVWAVTAQDRRILVRHGVDSVTEEGCSWSYLDGWVTNRALILVGVRTSAPSV